MTKTPADVEYCPYCGESDLNGSWTTDFREEWVHTCPDCEEQFKVSNLYNPPLVSDNE